VAGGAQPWTNEEKEATTSRVEGATVRRIGMVRSSRFSAGWGGQGV
jgi:hypothetical protein